VTFQVPSQVGTFAIVNWANCRTGRAAAEAVLAAGSLDREKQVRDETVDARPGSQARVRQLDLVDLVGFGLGRHDRNRSSTRPGPGGRCRALADR
jgi:hypothetical protein